MVVLVLEEHGEPMDREAIVADFLRRSDSDKRWGKSSAAIGQGIYRAGKFGAIGRLPDGRYALASGSEVADPSATELALESGSPIDAEVGLPRCHDTLGRTPAF
jgi:hypothetical protein